MIAEVLIEYSVKLLDKTFDYIIPNNLQKDLKIGQKVLVPFGNQIVEGFVMGLKNEKQENIEYKEIYEIVEKTFCLNKELIELGKTIRNETLSTLISAYQVMFPKALKASNKTTINIKTKTLIYLNKDINIEEYIEKNKRNTKEIYILKLLEEKKEIERKLINGPSLRKLITNKIVLTKEVEIKRNIDFNEENVKEITLTKEQDEAYNQIINSENKTILLHGTTGSGKTEVYIKLIKKALNEGKKAIMLVPEISLTPQIVNRFKSEFRGKVAVIHSGLSEGEKYDEYRRIVEKEIDIVVGARSAIFAPLENIGVIIIDECGSPSFKQEVNPKYNAVNVALTRGKTHDAYIVLGSATPLLEQYARGLKGIFKLITLDQRVSGKLPIINIVDMNEEIKRRNFIISNELKIKLTMCLNKKEQAIILLNRRGYSTFLTCSSCGFVWKCPDCDISLIYHKSSNNLRCHYCGYTTKKTNICPSCKEEAIKDLGLGTEKLEQIISETFTNAKIIRMDLDTTTKKGAHAKIIESFKNHEYDILIGTQMISKGLNFKNVTLVGIINADASLNIPDFRSSERTFELLMQTGGRTGRYELPGEVIIQTYNKENYVFDCVKKHSYKDFFEKEMQIRKTLKYPPYFYIVSIKIISATYELARNESVKIKNNLEKNLGENFIILGPSTASVFKLKNKYYFQIIIKYKKEENLFKVLKNINEMYITDKVNVDININPLSLL
jgi:primosomal protein N' (replication factor Y)